ncbi:MAG: sugar phosphate nucleotidyltransferase, partial [Flavisolibacter sp.]
MKVVIFAGGLGTRISEETDTRPKPMVEIGGKPILWHIMKLYSRFGYNDFIICLGYKGYLIKEYFIHYYMHNSDITIELSSNKMDVHYTATESCNVTIVDSGLCTKPAGRVI